uniref:G_PROTEIN_RECEP_F1_2 domain-containing protein n=1 Tax=Rhabditophanes sp. KR3021 TaxID=114890 RepID=A0AC35TJT8_9BILA
MTDFRKILNISLFIFSAIFNLLAIYIVSTVPKDKVYKDFAKLLKFQFVFDLCYSLYFLITGFQLYLTEDGLICNLRNFNLDNMFRIIYIFLIAIHVIFIYFNVFYITVMLFLSYFQSYNQLKIKIEHFVSGVIFVFAISAYLAFVNLVTIDINSSLSVIFRNSTSSSENIVGMKIPLYGFKFTFSLGNIFFLLTANYISSIVILIKYIYHITINTNNISASVKKTAYELCSILFAQSMVPFIIFGMPVIIYLIRTEYQIDTQELGNLFITCHGLNPTNNALLFLLLSTRNRSVIFEVIKKILSKNNVGDYQMNNHIVVFHTHH